MVNYLAIIVAAIVAYAIGAFWYSPAGFGTKWTKLMNFKKKDIKKAKEKGMTKAYIGTGINQLITAGVLAYFIQSLNMVTLQQGAIVGLWAFIGFYATTLMGGVFWENKPWGLYYLNAGHALVSLVVMGAIIGAW